MIFLLLVLLDEEEEEREVPEAVLDEVLEGVPVLLLPVDTGSCFEEVVLVCLGAGRDLEGWVLRFEEAEELLREEEVPPEAVLL